MEYTERRHAGDFVESADSVPVRAARAGWHFVSIMLLALVTGVFWGTWLGLSRSMAELRPETFLEVGHAMIGNLGMIMAILMPIAILSVVPVLYLQYRRRSKAIAVTGVGFVCFLIALAITLIIEVPIDNLIGEWTITTLPAGWQQLRDTWESWHAVRSWVSVLGLALLLWGALFFPDRAVVDRTQIEPRPVE